MKFRILFRILLLLGVAGSISCDDDPGENPTDNRVDEQDFYFGADVSYVNQILDHGGLYKDGSNVQTPYKILKDHGTTLRKAAFVAQSNVDQTSLWRIWYTIVQRS